jgi:hypothetical protein
MNGKLLRIRKDVAIICFKLHPRYFLTSIWEVLETSVRYVTDSAVTNSL